MRSHSETFLTRDEKLFVRSVQQFPAPRRPLSWWLVEALTLAALVAAGWTLLKLLGA